MSNPYMTINWGLLGDKGKRDALTLDMSPETVKSIGKEMTDKFFSRVYQKNKAFFDEMLRSARPVDIEKGNVGWRLANSWFTTFAWTYDGVVARREITYAGYGGRRGKWFKREVISPKICDEWNAIEPAAKVLITMYVINAPYRHTDANTWKYKIETAAIYPSMKTSKTLTELFIFWLKRNSPITCRVCEGEGHIGTEQLTDSFIDGHIATERQLALYHQGYIGGFGEWNCQNCSGKGWDFRRTDPSTPWVVGR